jgi:hypothetical protein
MRRSWYLAAGLVIGLAGYVGHPRAQPPDAVFYGIGDLPGPGGVGSAVRDATRVGGTIYAAGASTTYSPVGGNLDTPALWTSAGGGSLIELPAGSGYSGTNASLVQQALSAYAITPLGDYLGSTARFPENGGTSGRWTRVERSLLPSAAANLNISLLTPIGTSANAALALSDDGGVIYGQRATGVPMRYEPAEGHNFPDLTPTGKTSGFPIPRGTSSNGNVMVGVASDGPVVIVTDPNGNPGTNAVAFRYEHADGTLSGTTTLIPKLPGGTWNMPVALSSNGSQTLMIGDSTDYPRGAVYLTDAANTITATLGSPNTALMPRLLGGMTADGSVIAVTFATGAFGNSQIAALGIPVTGKHAYIHNSYGWFHFSTILAAHGVDLSAMGWDPSNLAITGIRTVDGVDLVFGQGRRRTVGATGYLAGAVEGFVVELQPEVLRDFNLAPPPPSDQSIVGAWTQGDPANPTLVVTFLADGTFVSINNSGFERGRYSWAGNASGGAFTLDTLYDTDGTLGVSPRSGLLGRTLFVTGDTFTISDTNCPPCATSDLTRIVGSPGSIVGGWMASDADHEIVLALLSSGRYILQRDFPSTGDDGVESGTYAWNPATHELAATPGVGDPFTVTAALTSDELGLVITDPDSVNTFARVVAPTTTALTSSLNPASYWQPVTLTATVTSAAGVPTGSVTFADLGTALGTATVDGNGQATLVVNLSAGAHSLTARYGGDYSHLNASVGNLSQSITTATTTTTLVSSPNPSSPGQLVNFVATVSGQYGGAVSGLVTFRKGPNPIGTAEVAPDGTATLPMTTLGTGPHVVTATYAGDANLLGSSSSSVTHNVVAPSSPTTTSVSSSLNPSIAGQEVTFTAVVTSGAPGTPTGTITFRRAQTPLATVPMTNGQASYSTSSLPAGSLGITAVYSGDAQFIASTSASLNQVVNKSSTTTTLSSTPNPSTFGDPVTFTATVTSSSGAIPTGVVEFVQGNTTLGSATLAGGSATFVISTLPLKNNGMPATHNIKAKYLGDGSNQNSTSNTVAQTVR